MSEEPEPRIVAELVIERGEFIHNDLANAAFHLLERVRNAHLEDQSEGIGLDIMAAVTMTAFTFESYINFIGSYLQNDEWRERSSTDKKRRFIAKALEIDWDESSRPFLTLKELQKTRDILAHGKPYRIEEKRISTGTYKDIQIEIASFIPEWRCNISYDFLERAASDVDTVWRLMLEKAQISHFETLSGGSSSMKFRGYAGDV